LICAFNVISQMKKNTTLEKNQMYMVKAKYIVNNVKSVGKGLNYALSVVCWYSMTEKEDKILSELIKELF
jgi:hypothetical protein